MTFILINIYMGITARLVGKATNKKLMATK